MKNILIKNQTNQPKVKLQLLILDKKSVFFTKTF